MPEYKPTMVIYHDPCTDGITSAALVRRYYGSAEKGITYRPSNYNSATDVIDLIDECRGQRVLMLDFTFKADVMERVLQSVQDIVVLDHHDSAIRVLQDYPQVADLWLENVEEHLKDSKIVTCFNMRHSGASLTERFLYGSNTRPFVDLVRVVDTHADPSNPRVRAFKYWSRSIPQDVDVWSEFMDYHESTIRDVLVPAGKAIEQFALTYIQQRARDDTRWGKIPAGEEPTGALPFKWSITDYAFASDLANWYIEDDVRLAIVGYFTRRGLGFSLRSRKDFACNRIAEQFGGGGHAQAAGFHISYEDLPDFVAQLESMGMIKLNDPQYGAPERG